MNIHNKNSRAKDIFYKYGGCRWVSCSKRGGCWVVDVYPEEVSKDDIQELKSLGFVVESNNGSDYFRNTDYELSN